MKRKTLDVLFSVGGLMLAGLLLLAGLVHASKTPENKTLGTPQPARVAGVGPYLAGV